MKFNIFTVPVFDPDESLRELNTFCSNHRVVSVDKNFVGNGDNSFWNFCITYVDSDSGSQFQVKRGKIDYKEILDEKDFAIFVKLRMLRKTLAEKEGVPAYALFTNEQLAAMIRNSIDSLSRLAEIDGVGKSRVEKYGEQFVTLLKKEFKNWDEKKLKSDEEDKD